MSNTHRHSYDELVSSTTLRDGSTLEVRKCSCGNTTTVTLPPPGSPV